MRSLLVASGKSMKAGALSIGLRAAGAALSYLSIVYIARRLTPDDFGTFSFVLSLAIFLGAFANLGIQNTVMRFIGQYRAKRETGLQLGVISAARRISLQSAAILLLAALAVVGLLGALGLTDQPLALAIGLCLLPGFSLIETNSAIARSYGGVATALAPRDVFWRALLIPAVFVATTPLVHSSYHLDGFLILAVAMMAAMIWWQSSRVTSMVRKSSQPAAPVEDLRTWRTVALPLWAAAIASVSFRTMDVIFLGFVIEPALLGGYFAASRTAALVGFVHGSINVMVGPRIARAYHASERAKLEHVLFRAALLAFIPGLALFGVFALWGRDILSLFSEAYAEYWLILMILAAGQLVSTFCGSTGLLLNMSGHERQSLRFLLTSALPGVILMGILGYHFGPVGAAAAVAAWQITQNARALYFSWTTIKYDPSVLAPLISWGRHGTRS